MHAKIGFDQLIKNFLRRTNLMEAQFVPEMDVVGAVLFLITLDFAFD
jgi:hypothetical protein